MTHTTPSKEDLRKLCEDHIRHCEDCLANGPELSKWSKHMLGITRALTVRLNHDDIIAEIEERNKVGEGINLWSIENSYWFEGFSHTGSVAPTITLAWAAFKGEKS